MHATQKQRWRRPRPPPYALKPLRTCKPSVVTPPRVTRVTYTHARRNAVNVIGNGVVVHVPSLFEEIKELEAKGVDVSESVLLELLVSLSYNSV